MKRGAVGATAWPAGHACLLLWAAVASALSGAWIVSRPELALGHVIGALLVGLAVGLAVVGGALLARARVRVALLAAYVGAVAGAIASRLALGFRPQGAADALPWLVVMIVAGPLLAAAETPLVVAAGAGVGLAAGLWWRRVS